MFIRGSNPIWSYVDLTGKQFDDTFYMFVLQNTLPYLPATVYHEPDGTPWNFPIQFLANGTLPEDIYFDPGSQASPSVYRLEFRQGPTQSDPLIYLVENYVPGEGGGGSPSAIGFTTDNQITNPQFSLLNFTSPLSIGSSTTVNYEIAPGWVLELNTSGPFGTALVNQVPLNNSALTPTNAPYALQLTLANWSSVKLKQRFTQNGVLWANTVVSGSLTAALQGAPQNISSRLVNSQGVPIVTILNNEQVNSSFNEFTGHATLPISTDTDLPPIAYIEYQILLPGNIDIFLTSIQLISGDLELEYPFEQDTIERQIDHTFHYFKPKLEFKPIPSYLVGWDFPLNPAQFGTTVGLGAIGANKSDYLWDQTIGFQTTNNSIGASRSPLGNLLITATGTTQFALIQYLNQAQARKILINKLSVMTRLASAVATPLTVSLWYTFDASLPNIAAGTNNSLVTGLDANGFPTVSGNWTELTRFDLQRAQFTAPASLEGATQGMNGFNGWDALAEAIADDQTFFAIVLGSGPMTNSIIEISSISLVPGDVPTIPAPQTADEVLRECEYYWEKSYDNSTAVASAVDNSSIYLLQSSNVSNTNAFAWASPFTINYKETKWSNSPLVKFYSVTGAADTVQSELIFNFGGFNLSPAPALIAGNWSGIVGSKTAIYVPINIAALQSQGITPGTLANSAAIRFHYTVDSRPGIILTN